MQSTLAVAAWLLVAYCSAHPSAPVQHAAEKSDSLEKYSDVEIITALPSQQEKSNRAFSNVKSSFGPGYPNRRLAQAQREGLSAAVQSGRSNIVYGKGRIPEPKFSGRFGGVKHKYQPNKFVASPEDVFVDGEGSQLYKSNADPTYLQKYMQKYANQLYNAHKHSSQLSEAQKYVLSQDVNAKKFVLQQAPKYTKFSSVPTTTSSFSTEAKFPVSQSLKYSEPQQTYDSSKFSEPAQPSLQDFADPITAERQSNSQAFQLQQKLTVQSPKSSKYTPKKVTSYLYDNSPQSTDYKYQNLYGSSLEPQSVNQYYNIYGGASNDKTSGSGFEAQPSYEHYGRGSADNLETPKITGYKIPGAVALSLGHADLVPDEKVGLEEKAHDGYHYPTTEPKYEFMYQVQDVVKHNHFGHSEARKGKMTWGKYYVQLPDGRFETVKYWADKSGYHAEVEFKGHAKHPSHKEYAHSHSHGHSHNYGHGHSFKGYDKVDDGTVTAAYADLGGLVEHAEEYQ